MNISYYLTATGEIIRINDVGGDAEIPMNQPEGCSFIQGDYSPAEWYIEPLLQTPTLRPHVSVMTLATYDLNLLPGSSALTITDPEGVLTEVPAQDDTLELIDAGTYRIKSFTPFPYIDFNTEVTV